MYVLKTSVQRRTYHWTQQSLIECIDAHFVPTLFLTVQDLILFPGDATFTKCNSAGGGDASRVYVLKFTSSSARHFYWLQDVSFDNDNRLTSRLNALIDDPDAPDNEDSNMQTEETTSS